MKKNSNQDILMNFHMNSEYFASTKDYQNAIIFKKIKTFTYFLCNNFGQ